MFRVCALEQLDDIICDNHLPENIIKKLEETNINFYPINV